MPSYFRVVYHQKWPRTHDACKVTGKTCDKTYHLILKFFQVDITGMFRMTSSARYFKEGVGSSRPN